MLGDVGDNAAAEQLRQRRSLRRTDDEKIDAHRCGKIDNRCGGVLTDRVNRHHVDVALASELEHRPHDSICFRIVLPVGAAKPWPAAVIINSDFFYVEHEERGFAQLGFVQAKPSTGVIPRAATMIFWPSSKRGRIAPPDPASPSRATSRVTVSSGEALPLQGVSTQCEAADQNREHELKRIELCVSERATRRKPESQT